MNYWWTADYGSARFARSPQVTFCASAVSAFKKEEKKSIVHGDINGTIMKKEALKLWMGLPADKRQLLLSNVWCVNI